MALPPVAATSIDHRSASTTRALERGFVVGAMKTTFPRSARVRTSAEYARVFEHAKRTADPLMSLHWDPVASLPRLGLAVSRKVHKRAVVRNRIKRALREEFRQLRGHLAPGDYVVVARPGAAKSPPTELRATLARTLVRAGALPASTVTGTMPASQTLTPSHPSTTSKPAAPAG